MTELGYDQLSQPPSQAPLIRSVITKLLRHRKVGVIVALATALLICLPHRAAMEQLASQPAPSGVKSNLRLAGGGDGETLALLSALETPHSLFGHNLLLVGDSNEREMIKFVCGKYGVAVHNVAMATYNTQVIEMTHWSDGRFCHLPGGHNISVMFVFHMGAITTKPHARWHSHVVGGSPEHLPKLNGTPVPLSSADLVGFWGSMVADNLPHRPLIVVAQSSLWDSYLAYKFLQQQKRPLQLEQRGLEAWGWKHNRQHTSLSDLSEWDWKSHVEQFLTALRNGFGCRKLYWRTNPNCPTNQAFVDTVSSAQADVVRTAVKSGKGIWEAVEVLDWRAQYRAANMDDCVSTVHYTDRAYQVYFDVLWRALAQSGGHTCTSAVHSGEVRGIDRTTGNSSAASGLL